MNCDYDVIVIGAGNGGMSAAVNLLQHDKKVLVLEKNAFPGGCATSFVSGRYEFEASLHELCQMGEGKDCGKARKCLDDYVLDVDWIALHDLFSCIYKNEKSLYMQDIPPLDDGFVSKVSCTTGESEQKIEEILEICRMITDCADWMLERDYNLGANDVKYLIKTWPDFMRLSNLSVDDVLSRLTVNDNFATIFKSYWDYLSAPTSEMNFISYAYMFYSYLTKKPYIAHFRSHEISLAFDKRIRELGGTIVYCSEVKKILVKDQSVQGVELISGEYITCNNVITNILPTKVFTKMIDWCEVPMRNKKMIRAQQIAQSAFTVCLGLNISATDLGLMKYNTFVRQDVDTTKQYNDSFSLVVCQNYSVNLINNAISDASDTGTCIMQITKLFSGDVLNGIEIANYYQIKDKIASNIIKDFEDSTGIMIHEYIEEIVITTPVTWARHLGTPYGAVYGYVPLWWDDQQARIASSKNIDYTIKGLRFCGGPGTQLQGFSQAFLSGAEQSRYMIAELGGV